MPFLIFPSVAELVARKFIELSQGILGICLCLKWMQSFAKDFDFHVFALRAK